MVVNSTAYCLLPIANVLNQQLLTFRLRNNHRPACISVNIYCSAEHVENTVNGKDQSDPLQRQSHCIQDNSHHHKPCQGYAG